MVNGVERQPGGRIIPALRYRNGAAGIDRLCKAFVFERKMVVPGEGCSITHAELTLGNGMIMLGDAETEYGSSSHRRPPRASTRKGLMWSSPMSMVITPAPRRRERRSCSISRRKTKTMAAATTPAATSKAMSGPSAPTILG